MNVSNFQKHELMKNLNHISMEFFGLNGKQIACFAA